MLIMGIRMMKGKFLCLFEVRVRRTHRYASTARRFFGGRGFGGGKSPYGSERDEENMRKKMKKKWKKGGGAKRVRKPLSPAQNASQGRERDEKDN